MKGQRGKSWGRLACLVIVLVGVAVAFTLHRFWWVPDSQVRSLEPFGRVDMVKVGPDWLPSFLTQRLEAFTVSSVKGEIPSFRSLPNLFSAHVFFAQGAGENQVVDVRNCPQLEYLRIGSAGGVAMEGASGLESLTLALTNLGNCSGWEDLRNLETLELYDLGPGHFPPLPRPEALKHLVIDGESSLEGIPWQRLTSLEMLTVGDRTVCSGLESFDGSGLQSLALFSTVANAFGSGVDLTSLPAGVKVQLMELTDGFRVVVPEQPSFLLFHAPKGTLEIHFPSNFKPLAEISHSDTEELHRLILVSENPDALRKAWQSFRFEKNIEELVIRHPPGEVRYELPSKYTYPELKRIYLPEGAHLAFSNDDPRSKGKFVEVLALTDL